MCPPCFVVPRRVYIPKSSGSDRANGWSLSEHGYLAVLSWLFLLGGVVNTLSSIDQLIGPPSYKVSSFKVLLIMLFRGAFLFIHSTRMFSSRELKRMSLKTRLPSAYT
jgi:hypothetical protein